MNRLTVAVLTKDEEDNIADCLDTLQWADELIVLDGGSQDRTVDIARAHGAQVYQRPFRNFADQRNGGIALASHPWLFYVDADERATPELAAEVREVVAQETYVGWWVPRRNRIFGRWIRHAGWYPDYQLRLFRCDRAHYDEAREVHELVILDGPAGYLKNSLIHHNYATVSEFLRRQHYYAGYQARIMWAEGLRTRPHNFVLQPLRELRRRYLTLEGYRDGAYGLLLSLLMAYYELVTYVKLWRLGRRSRGNGA